MMQFVSTRGGKDEISFEEAVFRGLAPDGGLYVPTTVPDLRALVDSLDGEITFTDLAGKLIGELLPELDDSGGLAGRAFPFAPELTSVPFRGREIRLLDLFHGPSCAFKDFGASFLAAVMERVLSDSGRSAVILTATSGDTGSAVAQAFWGKRGIDVVVLYPSGRVSPLQEKQLTTLGGNILAVEVKGSFDDCQRLAKQAFVEPQLSRITLTSANSINLGRLLPQSFYYFWAWTRMDRSRPLYFCVPSGNFGNLTGGVYAWQWGLPVSGFIAATNRNDVVPEYLKTKQYRPRPSVSTLSNAMDVGDPSNFERLVAIFGGDWDAMRGMIGERVITDQETVETISAVYNETGVILDPHTAVGFLASERFLSDRAPSGESPQVVSLATAHPGKFVEIVERATGRRPTLPPALERLMELPKKSIVLDNSLGSLVNLLLERYGST